jgi:pimeloyl-ACP methyl ester carboxylesterase
MTRAAAIRDDVRIAYDDDWLGNPWETGTPILLVHGVAESARAWTQWVPHLASRFRVIRPDLPGFGRSPAPATYSWSTKEMATDLVGLMDALQIGKFHLVGAKYGGSTALQLAADFPDRVRTLSLLGAPAKGTGITANFSAVPDLIRKIGVRGWADQTQRSRLGDDASEAQVRWWTDELMGKTDTRVCLACTDAAARMYVEDRARDITAPTLVVTTEDSPLQPLATVKAYQSAIANSRLVELPGNCYHVAAVRPHECAGLVREFIEQQQPNS